MNKALRYSLFAAFLVIFFAGMAVILRIAGVREHEVAVSRVDVTFAGSEQFIDADYLKDYLDRSYGVIVGQRMEEICLEIIEDLVKSRSVVENCEAWGTSDGVLHVMVEQKQPVVRFIKGDSGFYADAKGQIFPMQGKTDETVRTVEGAVDLVFDAPYMEMFLRMQRIVENDKDWSKSLEQYRILPGGDIALLEDSGMLVLVGKEERLKEKLDLYRKYRLNIAKGSDGYKSVNVKYNNQIICRKDTQLQ